MFQLTFTTGGLNDETAHSDHLCGSRPVRDAEERSKGDRGQRKQSVHTKKWGTPTRIRKEPSEPY